MSASMRLRGNVPFLSLRPWLTALALLALPLLSPASAQAHETATTTIAAGEIGPYLYRVGVLPAAPTAGPLLVSVTLTDAAGQPVPVTGLWLTFSGAGAAIGPLYAPSWPDHPSEYAALLSIPSAGDWTVRVSVDGDSSTLVLPVLPGGAAGAALGAPVKEPSHDFRAVYIAVSITVVLVLAITFACWRMQMRRTAQGHLS